MVWEWDESEWERLPETELGECFAKPRRKEEGTDRMEKCTNIPLNRLVPQRSYFKQETGTDDWVHLTSHLTTLLWCQLLPNLPSKHSHEHSSAVMRAKTQRYIRDTPARVRTFLQEQDFAY